jgi:hypothetical protein
LRRRLGRLKVVPIIAPVHSDTEIETAITALGREPRGVLVVVPGGFMAGHQAPIISAAARNNVPAVSWVSDFARDGGLLSYGPDPVDNFRRAATYVNRILRGDKPGDLPVQFKTKYEMVVNRKTAKALGLEVPPSIRLRADHRGMTGAPSHGPNGGVADSRDEPRQRSGRRRSGSVRYRPEEPTRYAQPEPFSLMTHL